MLVTALLNANSATIWARTGFVNVLLHQAWHVHLAAFVPSFFRRLARRVPYEIAAAAAQISGVPFDAHVEVVKLDVGVVVQVLVATVWWYGRLLSLDAVLTGWSRGRESRFSSDVMVLGVLDSG